MRGRTTSQHEGVILLLLFGRKELLLSGTTENSVKLKWLTKAPEKVRAISSRMTYLCLIVVLKKIFY